MDYEIRLKGVRFDEALITHCRRCCERSEATLAWRPRWDVEIEQVPGRSEVTARVRATLPHGSAFADAAGDDPLLTVGTAFAALEPLPAHSLADAAV